MAAVTLLRSPLLRSGVLLRGRRLGSSRASSSSSGGADDRTMSLVAAVEDGNKANQRLLWRCAAAMLGYCCYDWLSEAMARISLGAAATEQLFMQRAQGEVVLQLTRKPLSTVGEIRGQLTPVNEAPRTSGGAFNHRRVPYIDTPPEGSMRAKRHADAMAAQLPPVPLTRTVSVLPSLRLSAFISGDSTLTRYCRKSRAGTAYMQDAPQGFTSLAE